MTNIRLEVQWAESVLLTFHSALWKLYTEHSMVLPTKFRFIWPSGFREEYFCRNRPIKNKKCLWWPCLLTDRNSWAIFIEDLQRMLPTKFRFIWSCGFREDLLEINQSEKKNCLWQPCLITDRNEMKKSYRGLSIAASYQVSVYLAKRFHRRFCKIGQSETRIACGGHVC